MRVFIPAIWLVKWQLFDKSLGDITSSADRLTRSFDQFDIFSLSSLVFSGS